MLAIGTKAEYFQAVWVKNEWSRFLKLMKKDHSKSLFPCYRDMDAYDLPEEFAHLQGLDMSKIGFVNDLVRGIKKLIVKEKPKAAAASANPTAAPLLKRVFMFLEDGDFEGADEQCEKVLDLDPENAMAYVGKLMAQLEVRKQNDLAKLSETFESNSHYKRAYRFADDALKETLAGYNNAIRKRDADARKEEIYDEAMEDINTHGDNPDVLADAAKKFESIAGYRDSAERAKECAEKAKALAYQYGLDAMRGAKTRADYEEAIEWFHDVVGYKDADRLIAECKELAKKADYDTALDIMKNNRDNAANLTAAAKAFEKLGDYADARAKAIECHDLAKRAAYNGAVASMKRLGEAVNASEKHAALWDAGDYKEADRFEEQLTEVPNSLRTLGNTFASMGDYLDAKKNKEFCYSAAETVGKESKYIRAYKNLGSSYPTVLNEMIELLESLNGYRDSAALIQRMKKRITEMRDRELQAARAERNRKKRKKILIAAAVLFLPVLAIIIALYDSLIGVPQRYDDALALLSQGSYEEAYAELAELYSLEDMPEAADAIVDNLIERVIALVKADEIEEAQDLVSYVDDAYISLDYDERMEKIYFRVGVAMQEVGDYSAAYYCFNAANGYSDSATRIQTLQSNAINSASTLVANGKYVEAYELLVDVGVNEDTFPDGENAFQILEAVAEGNYKTAVSLGLTEIVIPAGTTEIPSRAFQDCEGLRTVVIPSTVTKIGDYAFDDCVNLRTITLPASLTEIGEGAFIRCTSLGQLVVPGGVTVLPKHFVNGCTALSSVTLPSTLTEIGEYAFANCSGMSSISIPSEVTKIGAYAFENCVFLTLTIPDTVTEMGGYMLSGCNSLMSLSTPFVGSYEDGSGETDLAYLFGGTYGDFNDVPESLTTVVITKAETIGSNAFYGLSKLTTVTFLSSVTEIGDYAFDGCTELFDFSIPSSVTSIGDYAFRKCAMLSEIEIPSGVLTIGSYAFAECSVTSITVPSTVTEIGNHAFSGCVSLESITLPFIGQYADETGNLRFGWIFGGSYGDYEDLPASLKTIVITGGTTVGDSTFYNFKNVTSITLPATVDTIGASAFRYCTGLTTITIPANVTSIGNYAFADCTALESIEIPSLVTTIGQYAFSECVLLEDVTVPDSVTEIGDHAFSGCDAMESITVPFIGQYADMTLGGNTRFAWIFGGSYGDNSSLPAGLTSVTVKGGDIGTNAFYSLAKLTDIKLPSTATMIGASAFKGCTGLETLTIPTGVREIGSDAFNGCTNLVLYSLPEGVTKIGGSAFRGCSSFTRFTVPERVTEIGTYAFYECYALEELTIPFVGSRADGTGALTFDTIFDGDNTSPIYALNSVTVTGGVIGYRAFYNCWTLTNITLPENLTAIGEDAFRGCTSLVRMTLPNSVKTIGNNAFYNCYTLAEIDMPTELTTIGASAFATCYNLTSVTLYQKVTSIGSSAFKDCFKLYEIRDYAPIIVNVGDATNNGELSKHARWVINDQSAASNLVSQGNFIFYTDADVHYLLAYKGTATDVTLPQNYRGANNNQTLNYRLNDYAFYMNKRLVSILAHMPEHIGTSAFEGCTSLVEAEVSANVASRAFYGCTALTTLTLNSGVASIGDDAFYGCSKLEEVDIPGTVSLIGKKAFYGTKLTSVTFSNEPNGWVYNSSVGVTTGTELPAASLSNAATAATYLKSTYSGYYWHCSEAN